MKFDKEDPKVGALMVVISPFVTLNLIVRGTKHSTAFVEGLSVFKAGALILFGSTVGRVFR